ncbi:MAG: hypothetical protein R3F59_11430 [Myxococcota bacterium]
MRLMITGFTLALVPAGCGPLSTVPYVPLEGGSSAQRALAREELFAFDHWAGPDRVKLRSLQFVDSSEVPYAGAYDHDRRRLTLADDLVGALRTILRHELCHALDHQEHLPAAIALDQLSDRLGAAGVDLVPSVRGEPLRSRRSEILASFCESGPVGAELLQWPCPGELPEVAGIARHLDQEVWSGDEQPPTISMEVQAGGTLLASFAVDTSIVAHGSADGTAVYIGLLGATGEQASYWVDLQTGAFVPDLPDDFELDTTGSYETQPQEPLPEGLRSVLDSVVLRTGTQIVQGDRAAALVEVVTSNLFGPFAPRVVVLEDGVWQPVDACPGTVSTVFSTPDTLWLAWAEGTVVHWAPIAP